MTEVYDKKTFLNQSTASDSLDFKMYCLFSATPCLYQEIRERGLHSTNQDELLDDFVVVEPPVEDQAIVVKNYKQAQLTWSQLPQVNSQTWWTNQIQVLEIIYN